MFIRNGNPVDVGAILLIDDVQYPPGWFSDSSVRAAAGIVDVPDPTPPAHTAAQHVNLVRFNLVSDVWMPQWQIVDKTAGELAAESQALADARAAKNEQINDWRAAANQSSFPFLGKQIACDALSRSDIDGVQGHISLFGTFPEDFPGGWKTLDNTYAALPDIDAFKAMYAAMTAQGTANFAHSQTLKARLAAASTPEEIAGIVW